MRTSKASKSGIASTSATPPCAQTQSADVAANVVYVEISSFAGLVAWASHYFGYLKCGSDRIELTHALTRPQAIEMNKRTGSRQFRAGNQSSTFFSREEVIAEAGEVWLDHFPTAKALVLGSNAIAEPQRVLKGPRGYQGPVNKMAKQIDKLNWDHREDRPKIEALENAWEALNTKFAIRP